MEGSSNYKGFSIDYMPAGKFCFISVDAHNQYSTIREPGKTLYRKFKTPNEAKKYIDSIALSAIY